MITTLAISGYRSLRDITLRLSQLTVVTGPNGSGKSNLYRGLRLLADIAHGRVVQSISAEGGLASTLWAGPERFSRGMQSGKEAVEGLTRKNPIHLKLGFSGDDYGYAMDLGLPQPSSSAFHRDPAIKAESLWVGPVLGRANACAVRTGPNVRLRQEDGAWRAVPTPLAPTDSMMAFCANLHEGYELLALREQLRDWRFYDTWRTDQDAPARQPRIGTSTPVLASDGSDLAAAIQTIIEIGDPAALAEAVADAFPGTTLGVTVHDGLFSLAIRQKGLLRPLDQREVSDGTLRALLLIGALLSPRPPPLMILNEPEASLHPSLIPALGRLIRAASERGQVIVVTHSQALADALGQADAVVTHALSKRLGETVVEGDDRPRWVWPNR